MSAPNQTHLVDFREVSGTQPQVTHLDLHPRVRSGGSSAANAVSVEATVLEGLDALFNSDSLSCVQILNVTLPDLALEPTTAKCVSQLIMRLPILRKVSVCAITVSDPKVVSRLLELNRRCQQQGLSLTINFVLDSNADAYAALGRQPTSLRSVYETSRALRIKGVYVRWTIPAISELVFRLEALFSLAREEGVDPLLLPAWTVTSVLDLPEHSLQHHEKLFLWDFIAYRLLEEELDLLPPGRVDLYQALRNHYSASGSPIPTKTRPVAILQGSEATSGWALCYENRTMIDCQATTSYLVRVQKTRVGRLARYAVEVGGVLFEGERALIQWLKTRTTEPLRRLRDTRPIAENLSRILVIGAYGGEHIGDAAILAGVLRRMHRKYGTVRAILMSQRAVHTSHLISMIETPVDITVEQYEQSQARRFLDHVDAVVFAGGPLEDLPKQLVKHLYIASLARRRNLPFLMEGVGAGPFRRWAAAWAARRLVHMAHRISVRTTADRQSDLMDGLDPEVSHDPALDYLESRATNLTRLSDQDRRWIEALLQNSRGRQIVGLNVRPILHIFTEGTTARKRVAYSRIIEVRFEERLAEAIERFHRASKVPPCFVFFPMNAIQFGLSDLRSAYRIKRLLRRDVDLQVWETDPSVDGIVSLLRELDLVIAMRFHAAIYALSQARPVIGIDYRIGRKDKVTDLFHDFNQSEHCRRIDQLTTDWLFEHLSDLLNVSPND